MGEARAKQLADRIQVLVAELLERRVKDPRLGFVTVTDARLTGDLREASVFYTVYGDEQARASTAAALESARGLNRSWRTRGNPPTSPRSPSPRTASWGRFGGGAASIPTT